LKKLRIIIFFGFFLYSFGGYSEKDGTNHIPTYENSLKEAEKSVSKGKTMSFWGWTIFTISYLSPLSIAYPLGKGRLITSCTHPPGEYDHLMCEMDSSLSAAFLPVPLIGPIVSSGITFSWAETKEEFAFAFIMLLDSIVQITGFALAITGHVKNNRGKWRIKRIKEKSNGFFNNFFIGGWKSTTGKGLSLTIVF